MDDVKVQGANRVEEERRVKYLAAPLPKVEGALLAVAQRLDGEGDEKLAQVLRDLAEELHHWF